MSEHSVSKSATGWVADVAGEPVEGATRLVSAISDFMIFASFMAFGAFIALFIEDASVHNLWLLPMEGLKHGYYVMEFMVAGMVLGGLYVAFKNVTSMGANGQTMTGQLMRSRIVNMQGNPVGIVEGFFIRIGLPVIVILGVGAYVSTLDIVTELALDLFSDREGTRWGLRIFIGQVLSTLGVGFIIVLPILFTKRCLHDLITGTQVVWADNIDETPGTIHLSEAVRRYVDRVGRFGSWFIVPVVLITCFDVIARKAVWTNSEGIRVGIQIWLTENFGRFFDSTLLQEMEWHSHTILFAFVLGYGYIHNSHVRVDLLRERFKFGLKAKLEFIGLTFFLVPFCLLVAYFAAGYATDSYYISEISASQVGLPMRWVVKSLLAFGLLMALAGGIAVWLQVVVAIWGKNPDLRFELMTLEWPEEAGSKIEGKERLDLAKVDDELERRARESGHLNESQKQT